MKRIWKISMWVLLGLLAITLFGWSTMLLWNWLVPLLFNGPAITFWQTLGLLALTKIFLWGVGGKRHGHSGWHWKHRYYQKLSTMNPEEREAFKQKMMNKWCAKSPDTSEAQKAGSS